MATNPRAVVVTGAGRGIGQAIAREFARAGYGGMRRKMIYEH